MRPEAVALSHAGERTSYAELDARSSRLAARLLPLGAAPEARIGLCVESPPALIAGMLGILKAGGVYVPLDPAYPAERLAWMAEDAGFDLLVVELPLAGTLPFPFGIVEVLVDADGELVDRGEADDASLPAVLAGAREPGLHHVHLRLHRPPQGGRGDPPRRGAAGPRRRLCPLRPGRGLPPARPRGLRRRDLRDLGRVAQRRAAGPPPRPRARAGRARPGGGRRRGDDPLAHRRPLPLRDREPAGGPARRLAAPGGWRRPLDLARPAGVLGAPRRHPDRRLRPDREHHVHGLPSDAGRGGGGGADPDRPPDRQHHGPPPGRRACGRCRRACPASCMPAATAWPAATTAGPS